jgi:hypothetical protein
MKKTNKENPLTFFRKANEARQKVVKNSLTKARNGVVVPAVENSIRDAMRQEMEASSRSNVNTANKALIEKAYRDALINGSKYNKPMLDSVYPKEKTTKGGEDPNKYVMNKTNIFGNTKFKEISKNKFDRVSNRYSNQKGSESFGTNESVGQQVISGRNKKNYVSRVDEVREADLKRRYPDYKTEEQELILPPERQLKKGGSVKSKKK